MKQQQKSLRARCWCGPCVPRRRWGGRGRAALLLIAPHQQKAAAQRTCSAARTLDASEVDVHRERAVAVSVCAAEIQRAHDALLARHLQRGGRRGHSMVRAAARYDALG